MSFASPLWLLAFLPFVDWPAFDPLRLRIIKGDGHHNPAAKAVYYPHRDTWYGHPQALIVGWLPLDDLREDETFVFFPDYLRRAKGLYEGRVIPYLMGPERCVDIDSEFDFRLVEFLMSEKLKGQAHV